MATTNIYLDTRSVKQGETAPLKIGISKQGATAYIPLNVRILPNQWDKTRWKVKNTTNKAMLNSYKHRN